MFDHKDHDFRPRLSNGQWRKPFKLTQSHGFVEGSAWHYQWLAPGDMAWLVHAVGTSRFNRRLEHFFSYKTPGWMAQYYNPYNETDLEAPFEFNFSGKPWRTQYVVRRVLRQNYTLSSNGIPGNDDCGEMSSWAVMSMMGLYTVDPASGAYELCSPDFPKISIHLHAPYTGGRFVITTTAKPAFTPYIQTVKLNGVVHGQNWINIKASDRTIRYARNSLPVADLFLRRSAQRWRSVGWFGTSVSVGGFTKCVGQSSAGGQGFDVDPVFPVYNTVKLHALNIRRERRFGGGGNNKAAAGVGGVKVDADLGECRAAEFIRSAGRIDGVNSHHAQHRPG